MLQPGILRDEETNTPLASPETYLVVVEAIWHRVRLLNRYVDDTKPWVLAKDDDKAGELDVALATLVEGLRVITVLLHAWMPASTTKVLGAARGDRRRRWTRRGPARGR